MCHCTLDLSHFYQSCAQMIVQMKNYGTYNYFVQSICNFGGCGPSPLLNVVIWHQNGTVYHRWHVVIEHLCMDWFHLWSSNHSTVLQTPGGHQVTLFTTAGLLEECNGVGHTPQMVIDKFLQCLYACRVCYLQLKVSGVRPKVFERCQSDFEQDESTWERRKKPRRC